MPRSRCRRTQRASRLNRARPPRERGAGESTVPTIEDSSKKRARSINPGGAGVSQAETSSGTETVVVVELTTVIRNRAGQEVYLGWGPDGHTVVTLDRRAVSPAGRDILRVYDKARNLRIPDVPYATIVPVEYCYVKLKDLDSPAEDYFFVNTNDSKGQPQQYRIGELELLDGIVNARTYFQDTSATGEIGQRIVPAEAVYTVIAPCFEIDDKNSVLAILFKPPLENAPQEATFQHFVVSVLRFLWQNDMKDEPGLRKGYYDAVQGYLNPSQSQVPLILRLAFTSEDTARQKWEVLRRWIYKQPEASPGSNQADSLGELDVSDLFTLAASMRDAARAFFAKTSLSPRSPGSNPR
jgi:hypothetical protein